MTDLDLAAEITRIADEVRRRHANGGDPQVVALVDMTAALVAELERLQRLTGPVEMPAVDAYENLVQALADERAEVVRHCDRIAELESLLAEVLRYFPGSVPGITVRSDPVPGETLHRWRSHGGDR